MDKLKFNYFPITKLLLALCLFMMTNLFKLGLLKY